jgi:hypothetical protein
MQNQVSNATKDLPSADMSIMDEGTTTSPGEVLRAVEAVAEGRKTHAFAVGATLASLSDEVKAAIAKAKLRVRYDGKQVIIANKENINKDAVAESFATPVEEIADDGLVVTARDAAGGVIQNEAVPSDPAAIAEAVGRGEQVGATSEVRSPNQAITESVQEVVEEAEALQLSLTFGEVEDVLRHESQLYARVAARNKKTGKLKASNRLIEVVLSDEGVLSRDDSAKPFALFDNEEQIEAAKKLKTSQKKFAGIAPLNKKGEAQVDQIEFDTVEINGQLLLRAKLPGDTSQAIEQQIRKVIRRGNNTPNKAKFTVEATRDGSEVHLHLGEVTRLGMLNSEGSTGKYEMAVSTQAKFLDGLYTLMLRGYKIDFDAARDGNKVIYGSRLRYKDGPWLSKVLNNSASDEQIDLFNAGEISAADIAPVLWGQGAALSEKEIIEILEEASAITEAVGTDPSEVHVVETKRKENQHNAGLSGTVADRLNAVAFPRGREGDVARREGRTSIMDEPVLNPVFDNARGFILNTASKPTDQVQNYLVGWPAAQSAAEYTLKMLNIKEQLVLFDEHSAAGVLSMYNLRARLAVDETQRATYQMYSQAIEKVLKDDTAGRIITPPSNAVGEDRVVHIFVAKNRPRVTASGDSFSRGLVLMHEIGHLVQYTHLDRLSPKLKALVLDSLGPENATETQKRDAFANWMAKVATDIHFGRKVRAETEVDNIFVRIVEDLKRIWKALRGDLSVGQSYVPRATEG